MSARVNLWDDNPSEDDLLGFDVVVDPIVDALCEPGLDPVTIGVHAPWGGGKTTLLGALERALDERQDSKFVVVRTSPWEYDDQGDTKGTLIAEVLAKLETEFKDTAGVADKVRRLISRVNWTRVGSAVLRGAVTAPWNPADLIMAIGATTTDDASTEPKNMAGFRKEFGELMGELDVGRVVVLVDDLDRCLPQAVMQTLEAIKLFLSVKRMAFVITADNHMVQDAIAASLGDTNRADRLARQYMEKIVQLPVSLPRLSAPEAEAYVTLLLARHSLGTDDYPKLVEHVASRRNEHEMPYASGFPDDCGFAPDGDTLRLASQVVRGLGINNSGNPRQIKRFLNALYVREHIAKRRNASLAPAVIAKLFLLEDRYPNDFAKLASADDSERTAMLKRWEDWGSGDDDTDPPDGVSALSRAWAAAAPTLSEIPGAELAQYLTLAATLTEKAVGLGTATPPEVLEARDGLLNDSELVRSRHVEAVGALSPDHANDLVNELMRGARQAEDPDRWVRALILVGKTRDDVVSGVADGLVESCYKHLGASHAYDLAKSDAEPLRAVARRLADDDGADKAVRKAAKTALGEGA